MKPGFIGLCVMWLLLAAHASAQTPAAPKAVPKLAPANKAMVATDLKIARSTVAATVLRANEVPRKLDLAKALTLGVGDLVVEKSAVAAAIAPAAAGAAKGSVRWDLPYRFRFVSESGTEFNAQLVAELLNSGLRVIPGSPAFVGDLAVFLEDLKDPRQVYDLPSGLKASVVIEAEIDSVTPQVFDIVRVGAMQRVSMSWLKPKSDTFKAHLRSNFDPDGLDVEITVLKSELVVEITPSDIQGFGLDFATVVVNAQDALAADGLEVTVTCPSARLATNRLQLDASGRAETTLRSQGVGSYEVTASGAQLASGTCTVRFGMPWQFLIAAILGGTTGAFVRRAQMGRRTGRARSMPVALLTGAVSGLLIAALYAVGVNVLPVKFGATSGEALVFCVAALGAFLGLRVPAK